MKVWMACIGLLLLCQACSTEPASRESDIDTAQALNVVSHTWQALKVIPLSDGFDYPLGPPHGQGYYNAQVFGENQHLGDDWNGLGGGNSDLGDSIHSISHGWVFFAADLGGGWGNVVRIAHNYGSETQPKWVESLYAHLDTFWVKEGDQVRRGHTIGTVGNANGLYLAHLHLEVRSQPGLPIGGGYGPQREGWLDPTEFIDNHRILTESP